MSTTLFICLSILVLIIIALIVHLFLTLQKTKKDAREQKLQYQIQELAAREVISAEERERQRIASDLHDGIGQLLSAALMNLNGVAATLREKQIESTFAEKAVELLNESYDEMRNIAHQMAPATLTKNGLVCAVRQITERIDPARLNVYLESFDYDDRLDEHTETILYRVIQEIVTNTLKHAAAKNLSIQMIKDDDGVSIIIEDDGKGFRMDQISDKNGLGIRNIISRINFLNGTVDIDSAPGRGTLIAIHIFRSKLQPTN